MRRMPATWMTLAAAVSLGLHAEAQIIPESLTSNLESTLDGIGELILSARYAGDIDELQEASAEAPYGELVNFVVTPPNGLSVTFQGDPCCAPNCTPDWEVLPWDRSAIRLYPEWNAAGPELKPSFPGQAVLVPLDAKGVARLSLKALNTTVLHDLHFRIDFSSSDGAWDRCIDIVVRPFAGAPAAAIDDSKAFLRGSTLLHVQAGAAELTLVAGETADMIGMSFLHADAFVQQAYTAYEVRLPGWAEMLWIPGHTDFDCDLTCTSVHGLPWCGLQPGYSGDGVHGGLDMYRVRGPGGTAYYFAHTNDHTYRLRFVCPPTFEPPVPPDDPAEAPIQEFVYGDQNDPHPGYVMEITDHASPRNSIRLTRTADTHVVNKIEACVGDTVERTWTLESTGSGQSAWHWIDKVKPAEGRGSRAYGRNELGRITDVYTVDAEDRERLIYVFQFALDAFGLPSVLAEEQHSIDGQLPERVVAHESEVVYEGDPPEPILVRKIKKDYVAEGHYRLTQYDYGVKDGEGGIENQHKLVALHTYPEVLADQSANPYTTLFGYSVQNPGGGVEEDNGNLQVTEITYPGRDGGVGQGLKTKLSYDRGFLTLITEETPAQAERTIYDVDYEMSYPDDGAPPQNSSTVGFCGLSDFGEWRLRVVDTIPGEVGELVAWTLIIEGYDAQGQHHGGDDAEIHFPTHPLPAPIPDADPAGITSVIALPRFIENITDVQVRFQALHDRNGDLRVTLTHDGRSTLLIANVGLEQCQSSGEVFDDCGFDVTLGDGYGDCGDIHFYRYGPCAPQEGQPVVGDFLPDDWCGCGFCPADTVCDQYDWTLFPVPRIVASRDARGNVTRFDYENGGTDEDGNLADGHFTNHLFSISGPDVGAGVSVAGEPDTELPRTPRTEFTYGDNGLLASRAVHWGRGAGEVRVTQFEYDELLRLTTRIDDPEGVESVTDYDYDAADRLQHLCDADGYFTEFTYDNDERLDTEEVFLNAGTTSGKSYKTTNEYDAKGRLVVAHLETIDASGQSQDDLLLTTAYCYDVLGRLRLSVVDPAQSFDCPEPYTYPGPFAGIGQERHFEYNWQGEIIRQYDTSGRGTALVYDGRGLLQTEYPIREPEPRPEQPEEARFYHLGTTYTYDSVGNLSEEKSLAKRIDCQPAYDGYVRAEYAYDDFQRLVKMIRRLRPNCPGGDISTHFEFDLDDNLTRTRVVGPGNFALNAPEPEQNAPLVDETRQYDEQGQLFEVRTRLQTETDGPSDPVTRYSYNAAGDLRAEVSLGDETVADREFTYQYDNAGRIVSESDSEDGRTEYQYEQRGNVTKMKVLLSGSGDDAIYAETDTEYDALSRPVKTTDPHDQNDKRHFRRMHYDSRGNLLITSAYKEGAPEPVAQRIQAFDAVGRQRFTAAMKNPVASPTPAIEPSKTEDRRVDYEYWDPDGRFRYTHTYNMNQPDQLTTETEFDDLGRLTKVADPTQLSFIEYKYSVEGDSKADPPVQAFPDIGLLRQSSDNNGQTTLTTTLAYDGHDRLANQTRNSELSSLVYTYNGLDRIVGVTDRKGTLTTVDYDLAGRQARVVEDVNGLGRTRTVTYNRLGQIMRATARNIRTELDQEGNPLSYDYDQVTRYRYDSLDRVLRVSFPGGAGDDAHPEEWSPSLQYRYDSAGRPIERIDLRGWMTTVEYDRRGLLVHSCTLDDPGKPGSPFVCTDFEPDALGRVLQADRSARAEISINASRVKREYDPQGNLKWEKQRIFLGGDNYSERKIDYSTYDQAGNLRRIRYPATESESESPAITELGFTYDALNRIEDVTRVQPEPRPLVSYDYTGRWLSSRCLGGEGDKAYVSIFTSNALHQLHFLHHGTVASCSDPSFPDFSSQLRYEYLYDDNGNVSTRKRTRLLITSLRDYENDVFNRLTSVKITLVNRVDTEEVELDLAGNRETYTKRHGAAVLEHIAYTLALPSNRYDTITVDGEAVTLEHDQAGNVLTDERDRAFQYDEHNRIIRVNSGDNIETYAHFYYDALTRRIRSRKQCQGNATLLYFYDGFKQLEERRIPAGGGLEDRLSRQFIQGYTYIDEPAIAAAYNEDGSVKARTYRFYERNFSPTFVFVDDDPQGFPHANSIPDPPFAAVGPTATCESSRGDREGGDPDDGEVVGDVDGDGTVAAADGVVIRIGYQTAQELYDLDGSGIVDVEDLRIWRDNLGQEAGPSEGELADGDFAIHGLPIDVFPDGSVLVYVRARYYNPDHGRWMQRDPLGPWADQADFGNPYVFAGNNPVRYVDPYGLFFEDLFLGGPSLILGTRSLWYNVTHGNIGWAAVDVVGIVADVVAILLPGVPGGFSAGIKATRAGASLVRGARLGVRGQQVVRGIRALDAAVNVGQGGYQSYSAFQRGETGWGLFYAGMSGLSGINLRSTMRAIRPGGLPRSVANRNLTKAEWKALARQQRIAARNACFVAGTLVATSSGLKPIEAVKDGDNVWAYDQEIGDWTLAEVEQALVHDYEGEVCTIIAGGQAIEVTGNHPLWVTAGWDLAARPPPTDVYSDEREPTPDGRWVEARHLRSGDALRSKDHERAVVTSVSSRHGRLAVYNLSVADHHTYAVSPLCILVHNKPWQIADIPGPAVRKVGYPYRNIELDLARGHTLGDIDVLLVDAFVEQKTAWGLIGKSVKDVEKWAWKQVYLKTARRLRKIKHVVSLRGAGASELHLADIKRLRTYMIHVANDSPAMQRAVSHQVEILNRQFPEWTIKALFGE